MKAQILDEEYKKLDKFLLKNKTKKIFLVCNDFLSTQNLGKYFDNISSKLHIKVDKFTDFKPNPDFESVEKGVSLFKKDNYDLSIAIGGGSAIDVAKCINLFSENNFDTQNYKTPKTEFLAIPTTAGTGSEATSFAVVYKDGNKKSIMHESLIPKYVFFDLQTLKTLPDYQKKCTFLDALCHAIESWWSVNASSKSKRYSKKAIKMLLKNYPHYIYENYSKKIAKNMFLASNLAGKAINIAKTTAAHAMSYKLTHLYEIAHGHAVAICLPSVWQTLIDYETKCKEPHKKAQLNKILKDIDKAFDCQTSQQSVEKFQAILKDFGIYAPKEKSQEVINVLVNSVNTERLQNFPVKIQSSQIENMYKNILQY